MKSKILQYTPTYNLNQAIIMKCMLMVAVETKFQYQKIFFAPIQTITHKQ